MGHGLTDLYFVLRLLTLITTSTTSLKKIVKPLMTVLFSESSFVSQNNGLFQQDGARCHMSLKSIR